ncbi:MAG TPA: hypothetical protein VKM72_21395 [Thermoanaerobaculia bacterium]|nr:hypothetical protein [Thermoanaerobaculia bacterium]
MQAPHPSNIALLALLPLLAWRVYARFRRMVGRQRLSPARPWITLTIFFILVAVLAYAGRAHVERWGWLAAGLTAGSLLAVFGLRLTRFEPTPQGLFYTPNAYLGIALSLLFLGRILYRVVQVYAITTAASPSGAHFVLGPLTMTVVGVLAGYYMTYSLGLIGWRHRVSGAQAT